MLEHLFVGSKWYFKVFFNIFSRSDVFSMVIISATSFKMVIVSKNLFLWYIFYFYHGIPFWFSLNSVLDVQNYKLSNPSQEKNIQKLQWVENCSSLDLFYSGANRTHDWKISIISIWIANYWFDVFFLLTFNIITSVSFMRNCLNFLIC